MHLKKRSACNCLAFVLGAFLLVPLTWANSVIDLFGVGTQGLGLGANFGKKHQDIGLGNNSAAITHIKKLQVSMGGSQALFFLNEFPEILVNSSLNESIALSSQGKGPGSTGSVKNLLNNSAGTERENIQLGYFSLVVPLAPQRLAAQNLRLGVLALTPSSRVARIQSEGPFVPAYTLYQNRMERIHFEGALAANLMPGWKFAFGGRLFVLTGLNASLAHGPSDYNTYQSGAGADAKTKISLMDIAANLVPAIAATASTQIDLGDQWTVGLVYRQSTNWKTDIRLDANMSFGPVVQLNISQASLSAFYDPTIVGLGVSYELTPDLIFSVDSTWMQYSGFVSAITQLSLDLQNGTSLGKGPVLPSGVFQDTFNWRFNTEYHLPLWTFNVGLGYMPSPINNTLVDSHFNLIDSSRAQLGLGAQYEISDLNLKLGVSGQAHFLITRNFSKSSAQYIGYNANGINAGGSAYQLGVDLQLSLD